MEYLKVIALGLIQGVTEWLPISSTGHLLLFNKILPLESTSEFISVFSVVIQLGSILAVLVLYWSKLWPFKKDKSEMIRSITLWKKVLVASIPAAIVGFILDDIIDQKLSTPLVIALALFVYGLLYIVLEKKVKLKTRINSLDEITYIDSLKIGCFQMLALIPGTSRSGSTILGGILCGIKRSVVAEFSFFMAIPVMAGASLLRVVKSGFNFTFIEYSYLLLGSLVAFLVSLLIIKSLISYVRRHDFSLFGIYRIILAIIVILTFN